jgi:signal transduction histidine kinase
MKSMIVTVWGVSGLLVAVGLSLLATSKDLPEIGRFFLPHHRAACAALSAVAGTGIGLAIGATVVRLNRT